MKLFPLNCVHFVGIGGIGMSAIAEMLPSLGVKVQGSNDKENANTRRLQQMGIPVFIGHKSENLNGCDSVVISSAIHPDNVELLAAKEQGIPVGHRSEMLAELLRFKKSICVAGSHGKTTTSSLIAQILLSAGIDPSYIIGGILSKQKSNAAAGQGAWLVAEADESDGSFLKLPTTISVVTNIEPEHLDYYKTFDREKLAFQTFLAQTAFYGACVVCADDPVIREILPEIKGRRVLTYGFAGSADVRAENIRVDGMKTTFDVVIRDRDNTLNYKDISFSLMGKHNILNTLAAIAATYVVGVKQSDVQKALDEFQGIERRLTLRGTERNVAVYDDYGHHPSEIKASIAALKEHISGRLVAVFQPHRYTRFQNLWMEFMDAFDGVDALFVSDVYSAGDNPIEGVTSENFVSQMQKIKQGVFKTSEQTFATDVANFVQVQDTVICLNAGSLSRYIPELLEALKK